MIIKTNTKTLISKINDIDNKINLLREKLKDRKLTIQYNKIKSKYNKIIIFVNSEKFDNKNDIIPNNITLEEKIKWYQNRIDELIEKQMILDNYIILLKNLYKNIIEKRILYITN